MNRNNIWIHVAIAAVIITFAGILGKINRWEGSLKSETGRTITKTVNAPVIRNLGGSTEVLVRLRPDADMGRFRQIVSGKSR